MKLLHKRTGAFSTCKFFILLIFACFALTACLSTEPVSEVEPLPFTKGVNMTDWFGTGTDGLPDLNKYDEADFACLKSMGVDVIRLPILFEFQMEPINTGKVNDVVLEKLDQVCDWAEKYQIYLVIDDHSFGAIEIQNTIPPETYETHLKALWPQLVQRYKNRSEYIIYEIKNEPPKNLLDCWDKIQREILAIIRQYDTKHTVVVTCANFDSLDDLVNMKPYEDPNLIYAFHFYEPGPFTNQGTHGPAQDVKYLPFPYDKSRMPELNPSLGWFGKIEIEEKYPQQGTVKYINAQIKKVASWAKKNNVRVWAGEIGAAARSMPVDRLVWMNTTVAALNEYNIPYCTWGIDFDFGFLKTEDLSLIFPDDIDRYALEAYGFKMPDESLVANANLELKAFPQKPYVVYDGLAAKGTSTKSMFNVKSATTDDSHKLCAKVSYPVQSSNFLLTLPKKVLSKVIENHNAYSISFAVKFTSAKQEFRLNLADSDEEGFLPWNLGFTIKASDYKVGEWVTVEIPLSNFKESGAWSSKENKWIDPRGEFDWNRFKTLHFDFDDWENRNTGDIYLDDIVIGG